MRCAPRSGASRCGLTRQFNLRPSARLDWPIAGDVMNPFCKPLARSGWFPLFLSGLILSTIGSSAENKFRTDSPLPSTFAVVSGKSLGTDQNGIIRLCGPGDSGNAAVSQQVTPTGKPPPPPPPPTVLPAGMRSWECVPGVIRDDGVDSFRLEVDANGVVGQVILSLAAGSLAFVTGTNSQNLHDDGLNGDRIAGDRIFTSERIRYNGSSPFGGNL